MWQVSFYSTIVVFNVIFLIVKFTFLDLSIFPKFDVKKTLKLFEIIIFCVIINEIKKISVLLTTLFVGI